jgi:YesN/AraC family two-component response regulator
MREILAMDCEECMTFWTALNSDYRIHLATTAKGGLNMLSENVDIVFLNIELPDMDGMEVLRQIKQEYPSTAVIVIVSCGTEEICMEAFRKGARDYMRKPLKIEEILQKIRILMNVRDASQRRQHVSLSTETTKDEYYPDIPTHIVNGILRVRDFVAQNHSESLTLAAACKMASLSKTYFCHFFKYITGHSLRSYHHVVKIRVAEELLRCNKLSIIDVALKLGYCDSNYFSTIYKKISGVSPRQRQVFYQDLEKIDCQSWILDEINGKQIQTAGEA